MKNSVKNSRVAASVAQFDYAPTATKLPIIRMVSIFFYSFSIALP
jgi:hypothetical protein